jgi:hypothetical protein
MMLGGHNLMEENSDTDQIKVASSMNKGGGGGGKKRNKKKVTIQETS